MTHPRPVFLSATVVAALVGLGFSVWSYGAPMTGIDDTAGPILTALGHAGIALCAVLFLVMARGRAAWAGLGLLAALLTSVAGFMLMQPGITLSALVALGTLLIGLLLGDTA
ncbi:hypothetical protein [Palleronia sediminis]|uniref:hypothetical protein n=1 Tax=Palleronia sediminis TaxID=2547833 RepID=UPI00197DAC0E|nr:hypothetical protein [Palleronia sediminis]